jgi:hypothetical protein
MVYAPQTQLFVTKCIGILGKRKPDEPGRDGKHGVHPAKKSS